MSFSVSSGFFEPCRFSSVTEGDIFKAFRCKTWLGWLLFFDVFSIAKCKMRKANFHYVRMPVIMGGCWVSKGRKVDGGESEL